MKRVAMMLFAGILAAVAANADEPAPPEFQKGMWEFTRVVDYGAATSQTLVKKKCTNPSEDMRAQREAGAKAGCKMTPLVVNGSTYSFTSTCTFAGQEVESSSAMTVESDSAYRVAIESKGGGKNTKESLVAKRIGDC